MSEPLVNSDLDFSDCNAIRNGSGSLTEERRGSSEWHDAAIVTENLKMQSMLLLPITIFCTVSYTFHDCLDTS